MLNGDLVQAERHLELQEIATVYGEVGLLNLFLAQLFID